MGVRDVSEVDLHLFREMLACCADERFDTVLTATGSLFLSTVIHTRKYVQTDEQDQTGIVGPTRRLIEKLQQLLSCPREDVDLLARDLLIPVVDDISELEP